MRSVAATLVAVAVALHSVLGCCWHHAHGHDAHAADHDCTAVAESHSCGHEHEHEVALSDDAAAGEEHHEPAVPHDDSCSGRCVFSTAVRVQFDHEFAGVGPTPIAEVAPFSSRAVTTSARYAARDATTYPPPQRLHALNQLLLI